MIYRLSSQLVTYLELKALDDKIIYHQRVGYEYQDKISGNHALFCLSVSNEQLTFCYRSPLPEVSPPNAEALWQIPQQHNQNLDALAY